MNTEQSSKPFDTHYAYRPEGSKPEYSLVPSGEVTAHMRRGWVVVGQPIVEIAERNECTERTVYHYQVPMEFRPGTA